MLWWYSWNIAESGVKPPKIKIKSHYTILFMLMAKFSHYKTDDWCDKKFSKVGGFLLVVRLQVPLPIQLTARFDWNIVESGVEYPLIAHIHDN